MKLKTLTTALDALTLSNRAGALKSEASAALAAISKDKTDTPPKCARLASALRGFENRAQGKLHAVLRQARRDAQALAAADGWIA